MHGYGYHAPIGVRPSSDARIPSPSIAVRSDAIYRSTTIMHAYNNSRITLVGYDDYGLGPSDMEQDSLTTRPLGLASNLSRTSLGIRRWALYPTRCRLLGLNHSKNLQQLSFKMLPLLLSEIHLQISNPLTAYTWHD